MKWLCLIIILSVCNIAEAFNVNKSKQLVIEKGERAYLVFNNKDYEINHIVTVKYTDIVSLQNKYSVLRFNKLFYADIEVPENVPFESLIDELERDTNVIEISFNTYGEYTGFTPNDNYFSDQDYISRIKVDSAWSITTGSSSIKIGILDSGVDWLHPDLGLGQDSYQNIFCNPGENDWTDPNNPNTGNHRDDDGNGFIDDYKGWGFINNTNNSRPLKNNHGTFVAGIIGAKTNNGIGISGITGGNNSSGVSLISYNVGDKDPDNSVIDDAIIAAVDAGCHIIQLSLSVNQDNPIDAALEYAQDNNVVVVCSSGKVDANVLAYPASVPSVIAVGGLDQDDQRHDISPYGENLSVVAPSTGIISTTLSTRNDPYTFNYGTSFAAPQVSAIIALMLSVNPTLTCDEVRYILESTASKVGPYEYDIHPDYPNGTWHEQVGYGLVNAYAAVMEARIRYIQNKTYYSGDRIVETSPIIKAGYAVTESKPYGDVILNARSYVTYKATEQVVLSHGFHAKVGSNFHVKIIPTDDNVTFSPQRLAPRSSSAPADDTEQTDKVSTTNAFENIESEMMQSTAIYTISGQLLQTIEGGQRDATHLPNGMYILQHRMSDGSTRSEKIANNK